MRTFKEFQELSDAEIGAIIREFLRNDRKAVLMGAHSTSQRLVEDEGIMLKILTDDMD